MMQTLLTALKPKSEFSKRIKSRHKKFWNDPEAEIIRNTVMSAEDPIEKWKNVPNWQRKLSNKYNSREFAKMYGCKVPDLYWKGRDVVNINFYKLPQQYVIRPTIGHSCSAVFLMDGDYNLFDKTYYTHTEIINCLNSYLQENPKLEFLVEEFLTNEQGEHKILDDYKIFAFNGKIAAILVINRTSPKTGYQTAYTEDWIQTESLVNSYPEGIHQQPPACLDEMIADVKKLSKAYEIFVRVDYYATSKGAVFGEFSPTPSRGNSSTSYASKLFTSYWKKYCDGMI
ncbi:hypothetical protein EOD41_00490 [Mucilaginibacter limnophilus]|uniref:ATP-grasp domain-containing protein n=1 Tax=Mucilaginibacter limnophilus TaxID=1932778 RepID=A0A3S2UQZ7_9SPHI|nr:ATP-grasp fold amidoligase family protein [Mucilaginibacter limnophilus]RVU02451.1 hypothetical protein EOD41_00490 [Mucilaginibacter limnophilus]